jgi:hypothetical protein
MANGDIYNGGFENNKKNGYGMLELKKEKKVIQGIWSNNFLIREQI